MRLVVGITGATGAVFGLRLLEVLRELEVETHLVISAWGQRTLEHETGYSARQVRELATAWYSHKDQGALVSSGSFVTDGMIIAPCSVKTVAAIAHGLADTLIARAADVAIKERRKVALLVREAPLSEIHLANMLTLARAGCVIVPPVPAFYNAPQTIGDIVDHVVARTLDQFGLDWPDARRWDGRLTPNLPS
jgi:4-hydroxy-3-polyprenylbenzoate decarboxylase